MKGDTLDCIMSLRMIVKNEGKIGVIKLRKLIRHFICFQETFHPHLPSPHLYTQHVLAYMSYFISKVPQNCTLLLVLFVSYKTSGICCQGGDETLVKRKLLPSLILICLGHVENRSSESSNEKNFLASIQILVGLTENKEEETKDFDQS